MSENDLKIIDKLVNEKKLTEAQIKLAKLGQEYHINPEYLYIRSKIFYLNKLYYLALDTLLIALEFEQSDKIYSLLGEIYSVLGNEDLSKKISDKNLRYSAVNDIKDTMTGLYRKKS